MIYLDNSATTRPYEDVLRSFESASKTYFANPSSIHPFGGETEKLLREAHMQAARLMHIQPEEVVFTSGGTEGNNLAIKGIAFKHRHRGRHIITSATEHPSVLHACQSLEEFGFDITYLPVNQDGIVSVDQLQRAIRKDTILISIMHVHNELGSIQPIHEIGEIAKKHPSVFFHVDHVQGLGRVPLDLEDSGIDLCTVSAHKIHGLKGIGMLFVKRGTSLYPLMHGGDQEQAYRSGTENVAGIAAFVKALRLIGEKERDNKARLYQLQRKARDRVEQIPGIEWNTPDDAAPHIINVSATGIKPEIIIHALAEKGIYISTKSACSSKESDESSVLRHCGYSHERASSSLRISMSYDTSQAEVDACFRELEKANRQLREVLE